VIDDFSKGDIPDSIRRDFRDTYDFYVTDLDTWEAVGRAHGAVFGDIRPASTLVQVAGLIDPDMLVEIEAEAVVGAGNDR
jgi:enamine deaminase RidA (YjgF/YER057c/UK114 family)